MRKRGPASLILFALLSFCLVSASCSNLTPAQQQAATDAAVLALQRAPTPVYTATTQAAAQIAATPPAPAPAVVKKFDPSDPAFQDMIKTVATGIVAAIPGGQPYAPFIPLAISLAAIGAGLKSNTQHAETAQKSNATTNNALDVLHTQIAASATNAVAGKSAGPGP